MTYFPILCLFLILSILYAFSFATVYINIPDLPDLEQLKEMIEYWQDQVYSIDADMKDDGLDKDDNDLTPEQIAKKQVDLEARKESEANRKDAMKKYSEAKGGNDSSGAAGQKRSADNSEQGPSKRM